MEHKMWHWRKKSSEKIIAANEKSKFSSQGELEVIDATDHNHADPSIVDLTYVTDREQELEIMIKNLNDKLSSALNECNAKDGLVIKHMKLADEAIAGWEKAEAEAECFKLEIDDALRQKVAAEKRVAHLNAALNESMQQLCFFCEEQEKRINEAVMKTTKEFDNVRINLEEKLAETGKKLVKLGADNGHLSKLLQLKEKIIEDLKEGKSQVEANFDALNVRLNSLEKENASLRYEVCMLEKELEMWNEERKFNHKSIGASQKQQLESVKRIAKLETECQKLRLLVQKRLPGPGALAKMRNEVEILRRDAADTTKKKLDLSVSSLVAKDSMLENCHDSPSKRTDLLIGRLCGVEEENKILKETLTKKNSDLQSLRTMYARTASKLSQVEAQLAEMSKGQTSLELVRSTPMSNEMALAPMSEDGSNEDRISSAESWASALISELEHFRNGKGKRQIGKSSGASDLSLMDDFVEMERLAIVAMDKPVDRSDISSGEYNSLVPMKTDSSRCASGKMGKELFPVSNCNMGFGDSNQEMEPKYQIAENFPSWIQDVWTVILQQSYITQRSLDEVIEEVQIALRNMNDSVLNEDTDAREFSNLPGSFDPSHRSGYISSNQQCHSKLIKSISKVIELVEGIKPSSTDCINQSFFSENGGNSALYKESATPTGYTVRVFQWKSSELSNILHNFVHICDDLLHGKASLEIFAGELTSTLEWIMNHCFSLQDVSSMEDTIKKHFELDGMHSESEFDVGMNSPHSETKKLHASEECKHTNEALPLLFSYSNGCSSLLQMEDTYELKLKDKVWRLKDEIIKLESIKKDLEERLMLTSNKNDELTIQLQESERTIEKLEEWKVLIEDQIEDHNLMIEDLYAQLTVARVELNEARRKFSSLEVEFEDKSHCCEEIEAKCLELQLQLESVASKGISSYNMDLEHNQLRTDWQISAASEKLAECQETIVNLGKQLKALASPTDSASLDKVNTTLAPTKINHHSSLLDQMLAEGDGGEQELKSPKTKEIICTEDPPKPNNPNVGLFYGRNLSSLHTANNTAMTVFQSSPIKTSRSFFCLRDTKHKAETAVGSLAIVPKRQRGGGGLLRRLLTRKKNKSSTKVPLAIGA